MRKILKCMLLGLLCFLAGAGAARGISGGFDTVRVHVVANSDSVRDQRLKLLVRDGVLARLEGVPRENLTELLPALEQTAQRILEENGDASPVKASLGEERFPETTSADGVSLPAGSYRTLRLTIGTGGGHNWWGVLYPGLCCGEKSCLESEAQPPLRSFFLEKLAQARQWVRALPGRKSANSAN